jgi:serine phosphatase RsbU (regulator of sigma subunit)
VVSKAVALIGEGTRDGAVARAVHDYLYAVRGGKVSATLTIVSADLDSRTVVVSRNGNNTIYICQQGFCYPLVDGADSIGVHRRMRPCIDEFPLEEGFMAVVVTDGIIHAGRRRGHSFTEEQLQALLTEQVGEKSQILADKILYQAMLLDSNQPADDMTVTILQIKARQGEELIRRMGVSFPFR